MAHNNEARETISVSMPGWLIEQLDAARNKVFRSRSDFVCEAIRKHILATMDSPDFWEKVCQEPEDESY